MVFEKVQKLIADKMSISVESIQPDSSLQADFGADSLDAVEIMMAVEDMFDIDIDDEDLVKIRTVQDIVTHIEKLKGE